MLLGIREAVIMEREKLIKRLEMDDLKEQHREIAEIVGMEFFFELVKNFGGDFIYIPTEKEITKNLAYRLMIEEFDGTNIKALAKKYGVSKSTAYNVLKDHIKGKKHNNRSQIRKENKTIPKAREGSNKKKPQGKEKDSVISGQMSLEDWIGSQQFKKEEKLDFTS